MTNDVWYGILGKIEIDMPAEISSFSGTRGGTMFFNRTPKKTNRAQRLIRQYLRGIKDNTQNRRYYFPMLYSALFCSPSPQQIRYISHEAETLIEGKDAFFVVNLMHGYYECIADVNIDAWK